MLSHSVYTNVQGPAFSWRATCVAVLCGSGLGGGAMQRWLSDAARASKAVTVLDAAACPALLDPTSALGQEVAAAGGVRTPPMSPPLLSCCSGQPINALSGQLARLALACSLSGLNCCHGQFLRACSVLPASPTTWCLSFQQASRRSTLSALLPGVSIFDKLHQGARARPLRMRASQATPLRACV